MRLLKENLIAWALLASIAVAVLLLGLSALWFARGGPDADDAAQAETAPLELASVEGELQDDEAFFEIVERPLFSPDRRPVPVQEVVVEEEPEVQEVAPPKQLNAVLTGVVITPDRRIVTLREKDSGEIVRVEDGRPLEGALAGWDVESIAPRAVDFSARSGESARLEMEVYGEALKAPPPVKPRRRPEQTSEQSADNEAEPGESAALEEDTADEDAAEESAEERAQELRRLIAERRERLREQARERREQQDQDN